MSKITEHRELLYVLFSIALLIIVVLKPPNIRSLDNVSKVLYNSISKILIFEKKIYD